MDEGRAAADSLPMTIGKRWVRLLRGLCCGTHWEGMCVQVSARSVAEGWVPRCDQRAL